MGKLKLALCVPILVPLCLVSGCSILQPANTGLNTGQEISAQPSPTPEYKAQDVANKEVNTDLFEWQKDDGLGVSWKLQHAYTDTNGGTVITILLKNDNDVVLPPSAVGEPILERSDGSGGWIRVEQLAYDPQVNTDINAPGLDLPLGAGAADNVQYRFDISKSNLWKVRLSIGNITWTGNLSQ